MSMIGPQGDPRLAFWRVFRGVVQGVQVYAKKRAMSEEIIAIEEECDEMNVQLNPSWELVNWNRIVESEKICRIPLFNKFCCCCGLC